MYVTQEELEARFGAEAILQLSDRRGTGVPDSAAISAAIADAEAEVNGAVGQRYALPLATVPDTVKAITAVVARYNLWRRNCPPEHPAYIAYRDAVRELDKIATGERSLPIGAGTSQSQQSGGVSYATPTLVFDTSGLL